MARYSKTALYYCIDKKSGMYIAERAGSAARWVINKEEAMAKLKSWWDSELNPDVRKLFRFEKAE